MFLIETLQRDKFTELIIFSRDKYDKKIIKRITDFRPYFYVDDGNIVPDDYRITRVETGYKDLVGNSVKKIYVQRSKDIISVRNLFDKHYEADINFTQRYIIDELGEVPIYELHTLSLDIETDSKNTFPNIDDPDQAIVSCAFADNKGLKRKYIYKSPESTVKIIQDKDTRVFKTEEQLLEAIVGLIKQVDPDVLTGWNLVNFDLAYMFNRMRKLNIRYDAMSPLNMVFCNKDSRENNSWDIKIAGRIVLDAMKAYMHFRQISNQGRAEKYSLEFTAQDVLGIGKIPHTENFHEMWVEKPNELLDYNLRDAELVIQILEKLEIIEFFNYIRAKSMSQFSQIYQTTALIDGFLLKEVHNKYVLPSKDKQIVEKYGGAYVFPPIPGLYENVIALDLKSLYPNIIKTFNVGYETFNPRGEIKLNDEIGFDRGIGIMSKLMRDLEKERKIYKKKMWKADKENNESERKLNYYKQYSIKVIMNAFYGYLGYSGSRLYKREVAAAITEWGQNIIKWSKAILINLGYDVIYGDTDSVYVQAKESSLFKLLKEGKILVKALNDSYIKFTHDYGSNDCTLEMEFEKIFKKILFVGKRGSGDEVVGAKKKYAYILLWEDNKKVTDKVKFTGFETVRCLAGSTKIIVKQNNLIKRISVSDLEKYDMNKLKILDEYGSFIHIKNLIVNTTKELIRFNLLNGTNISTTPTHKFLIKRNNKELIVTANNINENDKIPISTKSRDANLNGVGDYDLGRFIGLYLAEGSKRQYGISLTFHIKETEYSNFIKNFVENRFGIPVYENEEPKKNTRNVIIHSSGIKKIVEDFVTGDYSYNKKMTSKAYSTSEKFKKGMIDGIYQGDGDERGVLTSTSSTLIKDIASFMSILGQHYTIYGGIKTKNRTIYRLRKLQKSRYSNTYHNIYKHEKDHIVWMPIKKIEDNKNAKRKKNIKVYDIEVDSKSHLFRIANGIITHNSDTPRLTKDTQTKVVEMLLNNASKEDVVSLLRNIHKSILNKTITTEEIAFPKGISKELNQYGIDKKNEETGVVRKGATPPVIRGACYANKYLGKRFSKGSKPKWIYIKKVPFGYPHTDVLAFDEENIPKDFIIDYDTMIEKIIKSKLEEILLASGFGNFPNIDVRQKTL